MQTAIWTSLSVIGVTAFVSMGVAGLIKGLHFITRRVVGTNHGKNK